MAWAIGYSMPAFEHKTAAAIKDAFGCESHIPQGRMLRRAGKRHPTMQQRPVFPGYLFLDSYIPELIRSKFEVPGLSRFLCWVFSGGQVAIVSDRTMDEMREFEASGFYDTNQTSRERPIVVGSPVVLTADLYDGMTGVVTRITRNGVEASVDVMGKQVTCPLHWLSLA